MNQITVAGNISATRYNDTGKMPRLSFGIADRRWSPRDNERITQWFECTIYGKKATALNKLLERGTYVVVQGSMRLRKYEKDGGTHTYVGVYVQEMEFRKQGLNAKPNHAEGVSEFDPEAMDRPFSISTRRRDPQS